MGSLTCIGCDSPIHGTNGLKSPPKDLAMRIKRLAKGCYCRGGIWTHAEPPVWKFAVYRLALRPLGHDRSWVEVGRSLTRYRSLTGAFTRKHLPSATISIAFLLMIHMSCLPSLGLTEDSPLWVGAWWIGFIVSGAMALLITVPLLGFPKYLPGNLATGNMTICMNFWFI